MKLVVLAHGMFKGGAQMATLNYLSRLRELVDLEVVTAKGCDNDFLQEIRALEVKVSFAECRTEGGYPNLLLEEKTMEAADAFWISDIEYASARRIRKASRKPIVAHLHSYALVCPWWAASYRLESPCLDNCRHSLKRFTSCKIGRNEVRSGWEFYRYTAFHKLLTRARGPLDHFHGFLSPETIDSIDAFISVSEAVRQVHQTHLGAFGLDSEKLNLRVIYNPAPDWAVSSEPLNEDGAEGLVVYPSGFQTTKGLHILLQAMASAEDSRLAITRINPEERPRITRLLEKTGYKGKVEVHGLLSRSELLSLYSRAGLVAVPSIWPEPFSMVALEANYLGIPVLASNIGGLPEVVRDGLTGCLVPPGDPAALLSGAERLLAGHLERQRIRDTTRLKFNPQASIDSFMGLLHSLARSR